MASRTNTALLLIDPYNDFLHPEGGATPRLQSSIDHNNAVVHIEEAVAAARKNGIPIFYGLHQQWKPGMYKGWNHMTGTNAQQDQIHFFAEGTFGAEIYKGLEPEATNGDVIVSKHWNSNAFWNTDLDYQLRQRDITHVAVAGLTANTCMESTGRAAAECGYHTTMLKDCTAAFSIELEKVATDMIFPLIAHEVLTVAEWSSRLEAME